MKKEVPQNGRPISRPEMLDRHRRQDYQDSENELNEFSRRALAGLQYHSSDEPLEAALKRLDRKIAPGVGRRLPTRQLLSIAAAALALLVAGYFLFTQPPVHEQVFAQHFDYLPSALESRSGERNLSDIPSSYEDSPSIREKAMQAYEAGQYAEAKGLMEKHLSTNARDTEIQLYLGIVLLGEGNAEAAIPRLKACLEKLPKPAYERPTQWYMALALLQDGQEEEAQEFLLQLKEGTDRYAKKSNAILK